MFLGSYSSVVSKKNQLTFPSKFEEETGKKLLITSWFENSLIVLPKNTGGKILEAVLSKNSILLPEVRNLQRFFYVNAVEVTLDLKNRFVIPQRLKDYAKIDRKALFIGVNERIELWDEKRYKHYGELTELQIRDTALKHYLRIMKK